MTPLVFFFSPKIFFSNGHNRKYVVFIIYRDLLNKEQKEVGKRGRPERC